MSYFGGTSRMVGDPGFFSTLGRLGRAAANVATGGLAGAALDVFRPPRSQGPRVVRVPGAVGAAQRLLPGGATGFMVEKPRKKRRRMNVMNTKALKRADRRLDGFVRETKKVLKHTNYKLVTKSSQARRSRRDQGPGHTHVR